MPASAAPLSVVIPIRAAPPRCSASWLRHGTGCWHRSARARRRPRNRTSPRRGSGPCTSAYAAYARRIGGGRKLLTNERQHLSAECGRRPHGDRASNGRPRRGMTRRSLGRSASRLARTPPPSFPFRVEGSKNRRSARTEGINRSGAERGARGIFRLVRRRRTGMMRPAAKTPGRRRPPARAERRAACTENPSAIGAPDARVPAARQSGAALYENQ